MAKLPGNTPTCYKSPFQNKKDRIYNDGIIIMLVWCSEMFSACITEQGSENDNHEVSNILKLHPRRLNGN